MNTRGLMLAAAALWMGIAAVSTAQQAAPAVGALKITIQFNQPFVKFGAFLRLVDQHFQVAGKKAQGVIHSVGDASRHFAHLDQAAFLFQTPFPVPKTLLAHPHPPYQQCCHDDEQTHENSPTKDLLEIYLVFHLWGHSIEIVVHVVNRRRGDDLRPERMVGESHCGPEKDEVFRDHKGGGSGEHTRQAPTRLIKKVGR